MKDSKVLKIMTKVVERQERMDRALAEWTEAINYEVNRAVLDVIKEYIPTLNDYLDYLDKGDFECECGGDVEIRFTPNHHVIAVITLRPLEGYTWAFRNSQVEVEVDGTFESHLS